jgi:hypothetical protein
VGCSVRGGSRGGAGVGPRLLRIVEEAMVLGRV